MVFQAGDVPSRARGVLDFHELMDVVGQMAACRSVGVERRPLDRMIMNSGENRLRGSRERQGDNSGETGSFHYSLHISTRMIKKILRLNAKPDMALDFKAKTPRNKGQSRTEQTTGRTSKNEHFAERFH
jgi:hypothetical protein